MKKIAVLSGAGMSAESGIKTFRDAGGLWEGHDVMEVASPQGFEKNPELVLDFYNQRRKQLFEVKPNAGHLGLVQLEEKFNTTIITQNVDDLHERAGSSNVLHLHGQLRKVRSTQFPELIYDWDKDCSLGDQCEKGFQLRPHIVWFGEEVPELMRGAAEVNQSDYVIIIGTSMNVYPAAGLVGFAPEGSKIFYIDPNPQINYELSRMSNLEVISEKATVGVQMLLDKLL
ncbi:MAG: NAD-dependent deacylase [Saprospiraceae bacterium]|nr:NAD-dependent deacylase [Saprospiraceae bacterium]